MARQQRKSAHAQLDELRQKVASEGVKFREAQVGLKASKAKVDDASRALTDAYAAEDDAKLARERRGELQAAEAEVVDWQHRVTGAELRAQRARDELQSFTENAHALLDEREPTAAEVANELTRAVAATVKAARAYEAERQHIDQLVAQAPGASPRYDGVSTGYPCEAELKALERVWRENPEAEPPRPRWSGISHRQNLNEVHRRLREQRRGGDGVVETVRPPA